MRMRRDQLEVKKRAVANWLGLKTLRAVKKERGQASIDRR